MILDAFNLLPKDCVLNPPEKPISKLQSRLRMMFVSLIFALSILKTPVREVTPVSV